MFYPVSLSKPLKRLTGRARKLLGNRYGPVAAGSVALGCVWLANGLWHGAGTQYLFFGFYYFAIILAGGFLEPTVQRTCARLGIDRRSGAYRALQTARTFVVVCVGEMFFRAPGLRAGLAMFGALTGRFSLDSLADGTVFKLGLDQADVAVLAVSALVMLALGALRERNVDLIGCVWKRGAVARWAACCLVLCAVVLFGAYGVGYQPVNPMYAQF